MYASEVSAFESGPSSRWLLWFILFQFACQLALIAGLPDSLRPFLRMAAYGSCGALILLLPMGGTRLHRCSSAALLVLGLVTLALFNPGRSGMTAALAEIAIYVCTLAPLFWVNRLSITPADFRRLLVVIWAFHAVSSLVGVLQVQFPGHLQPGLSSALATDPAYQDSLKIANATGERVFRPMGLTDVPGGAAVSGFYAVLLGLVIGFASRVPFRLLTCAGMIAGLAALYMSQVRSVLVMLAASILTFCALLVVRGEIRRLLPTAVMLGLIVVVSFSMALAIAGESVTKRLGTFLESSPEEMYYSDRGHFLHETIHDFLPRYPLGAGLARWGMMNTYFGDQSDPDRPPIWAEIQWTGWLLDGGVPLVAAYVLLLAMAFWEAGRIALAARSGDMWIWAGAVIAYNLGALAMTFDYPFFNGQGGMELWMLNAALIAAWHSRQDEPLLEECFA